MDRKKKDKPKAEKHRREVTIETVSRDPEPHNGLMPHCYRILDFLIDEKHQHLSEAKIVIDYQMSSLKEDVDGTIGFGRVKRGNDLDRAHAEFDFVIIVPKSLWDHSDETRRHAIIDFHLNACQAVIDKNGEQAVDQKDRNVWRLRKPIRVFAENASRYGFWQQEALADAAKRFNDSKRPLLMPEDREPAHSFSQGTHSNKDVPPGATSTTTPGGVRRNSEGVTEESPATESKLNGHASNGAGEKPTEAWRAVLIEDLELPEAIGEKFDAAKLTTLGQVLAFGGDALATITGLNEEQLKAVEKAIKKFKKDNPLLFQAEKEAVGK